MHDELSALTRMDYPTFEDFYHYGIKVDGHPAGVHLFLKGLLSLFGEHPLLIRFPFIVFSILSVYQIYKIGVEWFSEATGLISASFITVLQYTIYQGIVARPYSPGLLVGLLLIRVWTKIFLEKKNDWKYFILYGVLLSSLGYIHYFALLFGIVLSLIGLIWASKKALLKFISAGIIAFVLYIPHLETFFYQLNVGGLDWLKKPDTSFFGDYLSYVFNHSNLFIGVVAFGTIFFINSAFRKFVPVAFKKRITLLILFGTPLLIGYFYSIYISTVLQFSLMIFGFPCFVFVFFLGRERKVYASVYFDSGHRFYHTSDRKRSF